MLLAELLPFLKELPQTDKLRLLHFLTSELLKDAGLTPLEDHHQPSVPDLSDSFEAAAVLAKALVEHRSTTHG